MNDLNSVYLVGRVRGLKTKATDLISTYHFEIVSNSYRLNDESKKYDETQTIIPVVFFNGEISAPKYLKDGIRVGANGTLASINGVLSLKVYALQVLDPSVKGE